MENNYMKQCLTPLFTGYIQIKIRMTRIKIVTPSNAGEEAETLDHIFGKIYQTNENYAHTKTCTLILTADLYLIVSNWKQPRCPLNGEWLGNL